MKRNGSRRCLLTLEDALVTDTVPLIKLDYPHSLGAPAEQKTLGPRPLLPHGGLRVLARGEVAG